MDNSDSLLNTLNIKNKKQNHVTPEHFPDKLIKLAKIERKKVLSLLTENKKYQKTVNSNSLIKKEIKDEEEETSQNSDMTKKDIESIINSLENPEFLQPINDESDNTDENDIKIPSWMVPTIKEMIMKSELSFMLQRHSDDSNNATIANVKPHGPQD